MTGYKISLWIVLIHTMGIRLSVNEFFIACVTIGPSAFPGCPVHRQAAPSPHCLTITAARLFNIHRWLVTFTDYPVFVLQTNFYVKL